MLHNGIFAGSVRHRRYQPKKHQFDYQHRSLVINLDDLKSVCSRSRFWGYGRRNLISFFSGDYLNSVEYQQSSKDHADQKTNDDSVTSPAAELYRKAQRAIELKTDQKFAGKVVLMCQPRVWGHSFNPVIFLFCFEGSALHYIIAEITNTPWGEAHTYVLECDPAEKTPVNKFEFDKAFHISPFLPMNLSYDWRFKVAADTVHIHMIVNKDETTVFDATYHGSVEPLSKSTMLWYPLRVSALSLSTLRKIYWQAAILWLKRIPFFDHPGNAGKATESERPHAE